MISGGNEYRAHVTQANEGSIKELNGFRGRNSAVINVSRNEYQLNLFCGNKCDKPIYKYFLVGVHAFGQKSASKMPVGSVQDFHIDP
jgi:hypothetical protein